MLTSLKKSITWDPQVMYLNVKYIKITGSTVIEFKNLDISLRNLAKNPAMAFW